MGRRIGRSVRWRGTCYGATFSYVVALQSFGCHLDELAQCWALFGFPEQPANMRKAFAEAEYAGAMRQNIADIKHLQAAHKIYLPGNLATAYTKLGDKDDAFYWLNQAYEHREMVSVDGGDF